MAEFDPVAMLRTLVQHGVRFVVVGGVAARLRGAPLVTQDVDITPDGAASNLQRLAEALIELDARLRTAADPDGVAFPIDGAMLSAARSWTLVTAHGDLDIMLFPDGTAGYGDLVRDADDLIVSDDGLAVAVASLSDVIRSKEAAGREKDRAVLPLLRRTQEELGRA
ncbi:MAG TPA: hypothetical protein VMM81_09035 [Acidimicrobiia bacterium]|nr:hypothetical protein [Acidimicrobiia bacterium]